jgi:hypothetical protein
VAPAGTVPSPHFNNKPLEAFRSENRH